MSEKPSATITTAALVAPLVVLCCLGPAAVAALLSGIVARLGGLGVAATVAAAVVAGLFGYGVMRAKRRRRGAESED
jgi:hypothetical protein